MSRTARAASMVLVALLAIGSEVAPASAQARGAAPAAGTACSLLTKEDAAAALGEAVTGPASKVMADPAAPGTTTSTCEYTGSGLHKVQLNLMQLTASTVAIYRGFCAQMKKDGLAGLGDVACWYNDKHEELQVLKGLTFFSIEMRRTGDPTEAIKGAGKKVFDRLK